MTWSFETEPDFQEQLDWIEGFVRDEIEPIEVIADELTDTQLRRLTAPLKQKVRDRGLWACHLGPELGGQGYGQLKLALMNEILGRSALAPPVFGNQAPDSGNAEILAMYGTPEQKAAYLQPLLDGDIHSAFSMTEPQAGADPTRIRTRAVRDGDEWVIDGHKWFTSNARVASFLIVMAVTDPDVSPYRGTSMFLVPADAPGVDIVRDVGMMGEPVGEPGLHAEIVYRGVRVPGDHLLGEEGAGFVIAQKRLGGGRIHHVMRWIGQCNKALEMLCERVLTRETQGSLLADKQLIQDYVAESYAAIEQLRLFTLSTAWKIDRHGTSAARKEIAALKFTGARVLHEVIDRAVQVHGALGISNLMPLGQMYIAARLARIYDGPDEVHKVTVARQVLKEHAPHDGHWPSAFLPPRRDAARARFADVLEGGA